MRTRFLGLTIGTSASRLCFVALVCLAAGLISARGQDEPSRTVDRTYEFDQRGDARIKFDFQLSAAQWANWKEQWGDHPDILLRDVKYQLAAAVIDDFSLEKDEVHRRATAKIKARALARYLGDGQFAVEIPKSMKLVTGAGTEWAFTNSALEPGGIVNTTDRAKLPAGARDAHLATGADFDQLVYTLDVAPSKPRRLLYLGILLVLGAAAMGVFSGRTSPKTG